TDPVRRNVGVLALAQACFMCIQTMAIATTPLAAHGLLGLDKSLATLPIVLVHVGLMGATVPASLMMGRYGRRVGFTVGGLLGALSGVVSFAGIYHQSFELLCLGGLLQGMSGGFAWYFRFAAADMADDSFKGTAISLVMAGGVLAGIVGPQTAKYALDWFHPMLFAGVYAMMTVYALVMIGLVQGLRIPRPKPEDVSGPQRPMREIIRQPAYIVALTSSMFGYGVMTLVMSATPLAMLACGFGFGDSATVIQAHVVAMFLPSFFTGHLIRRFGVLPIIATGAAVQLLCAIINLSGIEFVNFLIANILVGIGWNFTFIGGSTLLTSTYRVAERAKVQASHDFMVYATTAIAAGLSGVLQANVGWAVINAAAIPLMLIVFAAAMTLQLSQRRAASAAAAE
ncbi:MAG: MFS transporter, partial [Pseudomonadota bacterium]